MKKITLLCAILVAVSTTAQTTFDVAWDQMVGADGTFTVEAGDTVRWTWNNGNPHSVTSIAGTETFDSGVISGMGTEFEFTFSSPGATDYQCDVHFNSMTGTITVLQTMGVDEKFAVNVQMYPNPVEDEMVIKSLYHLANYEIFDMYGKKVSWGNGNANYTSLNIAHLDAGVYFLKVTSEEGLQTTKKMVKK